MSDDFTAYPTLQSMIMRKLRAEGDTDTKIGRVFGLTRARVGQILGARASDTSIPEPTPVTIPYRLLDYSADTSRLPGELKAWRAHYKMTQPEAAAVFGVHPGTYAKWEWGFAEPAMPMLVRWRINSPDMEIAQ